MKSRYVRNQPLPEMTDTKFWISLIFFYSLLKYQVSQSAGAIEYTDCTSAEG